MRGLSSPYFLQFTWTVEDGLTQNLQGLALSIRWLPNPYGGHACSPEIQPAGLQSHVAHSRWHAGIGDLAGDLPVRAPQPGWQSPPVGNSAGGIAHKARFL